MMTHTDSSEVSIVQDLFYATFEEEGLIALHLSVSRSVGW
jgi:hypothetical protein